MVMSLTKRVFPPALGLMVFCVGIGLYTSPYMGVASLAYFLMVWGIWMRKRDRWAHRKLMFTAMGIDFSLVLFLEITRSAVDTVSSGSLNTWQFLHVLFSTLALLGYGPMIYWGKSLDALESPRIRFWHRNIGILTFLFRTLGFFLMFSMLDSL